MMEVLVCVYVLCMFVYMYIYVCVFIRYHDSVLQHNLFEVEAGEDP